MWHFQWTTYISDPDDEQGAHIRQEKIDGLEDPGQQDEAKRIVAERWTALSAKHATLVLKACRPSAVFISSLEVEG